MFDFLNNLKDSISSSRNDLFDWRDEQFGWGKYRDEQGAPQEAGGSIMDTLTKYLGAPTENTENWYGKPVYDVQAGGWTPDPLLGQESIGAAPDPYVVPEPAPDPYVDPDIDVIPESSGVEEEDVPFLASSTFDDGTGSDEFGAPNGRDLRTRQPYRYRGGEWSPDDAEYEGYRQNMSPYSGTNRNALGFNVFDQPHPMFEKSSPFYNRGNPAPFDKYQY